MHHTYTCMCHLYHVWYVPWGPCSTCIVWTMSRIYNMYQGWCARQHKHNADHIYHLYHLSRTDHECICAFAKNRPKNVINYGAGIYHVYQKYHVPYLLYVQRVLYVLYVSSTTRHNTRCACMFRGVCLICSIRIIGITISAVSFSILCTTSTAGYNYTLAYSHRFLKYGVDSKIAR